MPESGKRAGTFLKKFVAKLKFSNRKSCGLVPTQVQILSPALNFRTLLIRKLCKLLKHYSGMKYNPCLPKEWNEDLAYIFGLLLGDGSLPCSYTKRPNGEYQKRHIIHFFSKDRDFIYKVYLPLFKKLFNLTPVVKVRKRDSILYYATIESKILYTFLRDKGFTIGRKAKIAKIPNLPSIYHLDLLAGLLDTDGGKKGNGFGLSTASKYLAEFCENIFKNLKLPYNSCPWKYRDHIYHQVYVPGKKMYKLLEHIPLKNKGKISFLKYKCLGSSVGRASHW